MKVEKKSSEIKNRGRKNVAPFRWHACRVHRRIRTVSRSIMNSYELMSSRGKKTRLELKLRGRAGVRFVRVKLALKINIYHTSDEPLRWPFVIRSDRRKNRKLDFRFSNSISENITSFFRSRTIFAKPGETNIKRKRLGTKRTRYPAGRTLSVLSQPRTKIACELRSRASLCRREPRWNFRNGRTKSIKTENRPIRLLEIIPFFYLPAAT